MKKRNFGANIGSSSILLIFVLLCLISFAALSIISANADYKLSRKVADRTASYYELEIEAAQRVAALDAALADFFYNNQPDKETYLTFADSLETSFSLALTDSQALKVTIEAVYPASEQDGFYSVKQWQIVTTQDFVYDESLHIPTE